MPPSEIPDIWEWWEPSRIVGLNDGDLIASMVGQFAPGSGHDFTQASDPAKPTFQTNELNGLAVAQFNSNRFFESVNPSALTAMHIFLVFLMDAANTGNSPWDFGTHAVDANHYTFADGNIYDGTGSTTRKTVGAPGVSITAYRLIEVISTATEWTFLLDGVQEFTTGTNTVGITTSCKLGANRGNQCNGKAAGCYVFSAKKTGADRTDLVDYINDRFAQAYV